MINEGMVLKLKKSNAGLENNGFVVGSTYVVRKHKVKNYGTKVSYVLYVLSGYDKKAEIVEVSKVQGEDPEFEFLSASDYFTEFKGDISLIPGMYL